MAGLSQENLFKDVFNRDVITDFANRIQSAYQLFKRDEFIEACCDPLEHLSFLERSHHIRDTLYSYLPSEYPIAIDLLLSVLGPELENPGTTDWTSFIVMPQTAYVSKYGSAYYELSMTALYEMTKRFSAENDLRTYIELNYTETMSILSEWTKDESPHVRRLVSEGTRPRLPLAGRIKRFQEDPTPVIKLLDLLVEDKSLYVRRSVANNINDIAKDNPEMAIDTLEKWSRIDDSNVRWVIRHASRSLVKQGNTRMLTILGYKEEPTIHIKQFSIEESCYSIGDAIEFTVVIDNIGSLEEALMIDYVIHYVKANNRIIEKVFKMRKTIIKSKQSFTFTKIHYLRNTSGRQHYPGIHCVELIVNGIRYKEIAFELKS